MKNYKEELIEFLYKELAIEYAGESTFGWLSAGRLWMETKNYYDANGIICGGGYASWGKLITVSLNLDGDMIRFNLKINELISYKRDKTLRDLLA